MAENDDKKHPATGRRLGQLKHEGNTLRSRDFSGGAILIISLMTLSIISPTIVNNFKNNFIVSFSNFQIVMESHDYIQVILRELILNNFYQLLPIFIILIGVTFLTPFLYGGWNFTLGVFKFDLNRLNPFTGITRIFTPQRALTEIGKSFLKSSIFILVMVLYLLSNKNSIVSFMSEPLHVAIDASTILIKSFITSLSVTLIFLIAFDMYYQHHIYFEETKMSTQEVKDEAKDMEGSTEVKGKIKARQLALLKQRIMKTVPGSTVVLTNPTHYAVALKYDSSKDIAPRVVAKGTDLVAQHIRQVATSHAVTIYEAPELARAVYHTTKVGHAIHPELYKAVAIVLSYVYQLKNYQMGRAALPEFVNNLEIPKEFIFKE